jgi:hypothetical protein
MRLHTAAPLPTNHRDVPLSHWLAAWQASVLCASSDASDLAQIRAVRGGAADWIEHGSTNN